MRRRRSCTESCDAAEKTESYSGIREFPGLLKAVDFVNSNLRGETSSEYALDPWTRIAIHNSMLFPVGTDAVETGLSFEGVGSKNPSQALALQNAVDARTATPFNRYARSTDRASTVHVPKTRPPIGAQGCALREGWPKHLRTFQREYAHVVWTNLHRAAHRHSIGPRASLRRVRWQEHARWHVGFRSRLRDCG